MYILGTKFSAQMRAGIEFLMLELSGFYCIPCVREMLQICKPVCMHLYEDLCGIVVVVQ